MAEKQILNFEAGSRNKTDIKFNGAFYIHS